jgi:hypothetical protein
MGELTIVIDANAVEVANSLYGSIHLFRIKIKE